MATGEEELRRLLAKGEVVVVAGAGVSMSVVGDQTVDDHPVASWTGLLRHGIDRAPNKTEEWRERRRADVDSGDVGEMVNVAGSITRELQGPQGGAYAKWLNDTIGALEPRNRGLIEALELLRAPIATTNYDHLIEQVTAMDRLTWEDGARWQAVIRGDERAVLHIHGHYRVPSSVILGVSSYADIRNNEPVQAMLQALGQSKTLLFVGIGAGLDDPNFGALREWLRRVTPDSMYAHYRLVRKGEEVDQDPAERIELIEYGDRYDDLEGFLRRIAPEPPAGVERRVPVAVRKPRILELRIERDGVKAKARRTGKTAEEPLHLDDLLVSMAQMLEGWLRRREPDAFDPQGALLESEPEEAKLLGRILYQAIFHGDVRELLVEELKDARAAGSDDRLALVLKVDRVRVPSLDGGPDVDLTELPWELLHSPEDAWLAQNRSLTLFRALHGDQGTVSAARGKLRVLVIKAQPADVLEAARFQWDPVRARAYDERMDEITRHLASLDKTHDVVTQVRVVDEPTLSAVVEALDEPADIVHYLGYGSVDASQRRLVALLDEDGRAVWPLSDPFARLFRLAPPSIVFLHLCEGPREGYSYDFARASFTELAGLLLRHGVQLVVAMQYPMSPDVGLEFTKSFYAGIQSPEEAVHNARRQASSFYRLGAAVLYLHDDASLATVNGAHAIADESAHRKERSVTERGQEVTRTVPAQPGRAEPEPPKAPPVPTKQGVLPGATRVSFADLQLKAEEIARRANQDADRFKEQSAGLYVDVRGDEDGTLDPAVLARAAHDRAKLGSPGESALLWEQLSDHLRPRPRADLGY